MTHTLQLIPVFLLAALPAVPCAAAAATKPLKVFLLAGQSNMQGHAKVSTFEHIGMDPATKPMLAEMLDADGKPKVCERVWISSIGCADAEQTGKLTAGFAWFQGWNDMVDSGTYPNRDRHGGYDAYSTAMSHFIRDVRRDLNAPRLPFVIGVLGVGGPTAEYGPDQQRYKATHQTSAHRKSSAASAKAWRRR